MGKPRWRFDHSLLWEEAYSTQIESGVKMFFETNSGTPDDMMVWEAFKAYVWGILISLKSYRVKQFNKVCTEILQEISNLEALHKANLQEAIYLA